MTSLRIHETTFEMARKNPQITEEAIEKAWDKYADTLKLHGCHTTSATVRAMAPPRGMPTTGGGDAHHMDLDQQDHKGSLLLQRLPHTWRRKMTRTKPPRWRSIPLKQGEAPVALGAIG